VAYSFTDSGMKVFGGSLEEALDQLSTESFMNLWEYTIHENALHEEIKKEE